jgi:hypothetical protein
MPGASLFYITDPYRLPITSLWNLCWNLQRVSATKSLMRFCTHGSDAKKIFFTYWGSRQDSRQRTASGYRSPCNWQSVYSPNLPPRLGEASAIWTSYWGYMPAGEEISNMSLRRLCRPLNGVFGHWMKVSQLYHESDPFRGPGAAGRRGWKTLGK